MADPTIRLVRLSSIALLAGGLAAALVMAGPLPAAAAQDAPGLIDGWKVDYDTDRCYMVRATGDGLQGIEFQLLADNTARMLFMRNGWPIRTGTSPATVTINGERMAWTASLSHSGEAQLVSFEINDNVLDGLAAGAAIGLDLPELGISASFDIGTIVAARNELYDCADWML